MVELIKMNFNLEINILLETNAIKIAWYGGLPRRSSSKDGVEQVYYVRVALLVAILADTSSGKSLVIPLVTLKNIFMLKLRSVN